MRAPGPSRPDGDRRRRARAHPLAAAPAARARGEGRRRLPAVGLGGRGRERPRGRRAPPRLDVAPARGCSLRARAARAGRLPAGADRRRPRRGRPRRARAHVRPGGARDGRHPPPALGDRPVHARLRHALVARATCCGSGPLHGTHAPPFYVCGSDQWVAGYMEGAVSHRALGRVGSRARAPAAPQRARARAARRAAGRGVTAVPSSSANGSGLPSFEIVALSSFAAEDPDVHLVQRRRGRPRARPARAGGCRRARPCGSIPIRSGLIIAFTSPRELVSPCSARNVALADAAGCTRRRRRLASASSRFETPRKSATNSVSRLLVDLPRRARLLDPALVHHRDAVAHRERFLLVVRDEDERDAEVGLDRLQLDLQVLAQPRVERSERLVEQEHARHQDERAGERDPLLLTAGELLGLALARSSASRTRSRIPLTLRRRSSLVSRWYLSPKRDVAGDVEVREERVALEDRVDVALVRRHAGRRRCRRA